MMKGNPPVAQIRRLAARDSGERPRYSAERIHGCFDGVLLLELSDHGVPVLYKRIHRRVGSPPREGADISGMSPVAASACASVSVVSMGLISPLTFLRILSRLFRIAGKSLNNLESVAGDDHQCQDLSGVEASGEIFHQLAASVCLIEKRSVDGIESNDGHGSRLLLRQESGW